MIAYEQESCDPNHYQRMLIAPPESPVLQSSLDQHYHGPTIEQPDVEYLPGDDDNQFQKITIGFQDTYPSSIYNDENNIESARSIPSQIKGYANP